MKTRVSKFSLSIVLLVAVVFGGIAIQANKLNTYEAKANYEPRAVVMDAVADDYVGTWENIDLDAQLIITKGETENSLNVSLLYGGEAMGEPVPAVYEEAEDRYHGVNDFFDFYLTLSDGDLIYTPIIMGIVQEPYTFTRVA